MGRNWFLVLGDIKKIHCRGERIDSGSQDSRTSLMLARVCWIFG
jgi:hypothetical protein